MSARQTVLNTLFGGTSIVVFIVAFGLTLADLPPASFLNAGQAWLTGDNSYFPVLSACLLAMPFLVVLGLAKFAVVAAHNALFVTDEAQRLKFR